MLEELNVFVTRQCNVRCSHCLVPSSPLRQDAVLDFDLYTSALDQLVELGGSEVHILGGEPLLVAGLRRYIAAASERGLHTRLATNGQLLTRDLVREYISLGLASIGFSLDGPAAVHDGMRTEGNHAKVTDLIGCCHAEGLDTSVSILLNKANVSHLGTHLQALVGLGLTKICCFGMIPVGHAQARADDALTAAAWKETVSFATSMLEELGFQGQLFYHSGHLDAFSGCRLSPPFHSLDFMPDGSLFSCFLLSQFGSMALGNIKRRSLIEVLERGKAAPLAGMDPAIGCPALQVAQPDMLELQAACHNTFGCTSF